MLIDPFTLVAQALNFLILVWLLKRFLYKPILKAIDTREQRIASELADADARKTEARQEREVYRRKNEEFDAQRVGLLAKANEDAKAERERLFGDAARDAQAEKVTRQDALMKDAKALDQVISGRVQSEVFAIVRKTLADLSTATLEERMVDVFARRLRDMDGAAKNTLALAMRNHQADPVLVRSAFDLPTEQRAAIQNAVNVASAADVNLRFETTPDIVGGIELTANGQRVGWNIANYLSSLENVVQSVLQEPRPVNG